MAISTQGIELLYKKENSYVNLVDIKSFPDLGSAPQTIETTTLSSDCQTFIKGIDASAIMEFTANYDPNVYKTLIELDEDTEFAICFGDDSEFHWSGALSVVVVGGAVNGVVEMKISIMPTTKITKLPI